MKTFTAIVALVGGACAINRVPISIKLLQTRFADDLNANDMDELMTESTWKGYETAKITDVDNVEPKPVETNENDDFKDERFILIDSAPQNKESKLPTCDKFLTVNCQPVCSETLTRGCTEARTPNAPDPYRYSGASTYSPGTTSF